jgi:transcriptional regulator with XRE-family HTH domain
VTKRLKTRARQLRYQYQAQIGKRVTIEEVAKAIGVDRRALMKIELSQLQLYDADVIQRLAAFYEKAGLDARNIVEYTNEDIGTPSYALG